ncbi:FG-GAP-like repeat-containing protein [Actinosynnema sp. NPDC023794]
MVRRILVGAALVLAGVGAPQPHSAAIPSCASPVPATIADAVAAECGHSVEVMTPRAGWREVARPDGTRRVEIRSGHGTGASRWAYSNSGNATNETSVARVGRSPDSGATYRSYFEFPIAPVAGTRIISATFSINLAHSWSCADTPVTAWRTAGIASAPRTVWVANPFQAYLSTQYESANKDACPTPATPLMNFPATGDVQAAANAQWSTYTVGLSARDSSGNGETTQDRWKKFLPGTAKFVIEYNRAPVAPTAMTVDPAPSCTTTPTFLNSTAGVTLRARLSDPDGDNVSAQWRLSGVAPQHVPPASTPAAAGPVSTLVPAAAFTEGGTYTWSVRGHDGTDAGPWGPDCSFTVNNALPDPPVATSTELALDTATIPPSPPPTAIVGRPAVVTLAPAPGDTHVAGFLYNVGNGVAEPPQVWAPLTSGTTVDVPVPPLGTGHDLTVLTVRARDRTGQEGATATYRFRAAPAPEHPRTTGDVTGDGRGDLLQVRDVGGELTAWISPLTSDVNRAFPAARVFHGGSAFPTASSRWADGDADADGRTDLVVVRAPAAGRVDVSVLTSAGLALFAQPPVWDSGTADWDLTTLQVIMADVDGDARDDVLLARPDGVRVMRSTAGGLTAPEPWYTGAVVGRVRAGDLTGDGRADLVRSLDGDAWVHASTGTAFDPATRWWSGLPIPTPVPYLPVVVVGDVDGAGPDDLVLFSRAEIRALLSDGAALRSATWSTGSSDPVRTKLGATDVDGDALADLVAVVDSGYARTITRVIRSTGTGFQPLQTISDTSGQEWASVGFGTTGVLTDLTSDATPTASSSAPEEWGWAPRFALDGRRDSTTTGGWSSYSNLEIPHSEWFELSFPTPRAVNRVDFYARKDATPENGAHFPSRSVVDVWTGAGWEQVSEIQLAAGAVPTLITSSFPARTTTRIRWTGSGLILMQVAEIEAYLVQ